MKKKQLEEICDKQKFVLEIYMNLNYENQTKDVFNMISDFYENEKHVEHEVNTDISVNEIINVIWNNYLTKINKIIFNLINK